MLQITKRMRPTMSLAPLKPKAEVLSEDRWWKGFGMPDRDLGVRRRTFDEYYDSIARIRLHPGVPEDVAQSFENARNTYLYAYFAHRLLMVAELQVRVSVEYGLREKAKLSGLKAYESWGMKRLFVEAIRRRWIEDNGFERFRCNEELKRRNAEAWPEHYIYKTPSDAQGYCRLLAESFPYIRNELAHGSGMLSPTGVGSFEIAVDLIHQLFPLDSRPVPGPVVPIDRAAAIGR